MARSNSARVLSFIGLFAFSELLVQSKTVNQIIETVELKAVKLPTKEDYKKIFHATLLSLLASICSRLPVAQGFYRTCYQLVEKRIIRTRQEIQAKYKYLIRPL